MTPGDPVTWPGGVTPRIGILIALIEPNEAPAVPAGVGRARRRFRPTSQAPRYLCREDSTGYYFAPLRGSVTAVRP